MKVNVKDIAGRLEMLFDDYLYLLDKRTGEIFEIDEHYLRIAEESDEDDNFDEYREWEKKNIQDAIKFFQEEKYYISLPSKYDIHEYQIMEDFIYSLTNEGHINRLERAITGKGFSEQDLYTNIEKDIRAYDAGKLDVTIKNLPKRWQGELNPNSIYVCNLIYFLSI